MTHSSSAVWLMMTEGTKTLWQTVLLQYLCTMPSQWKYLDSKANQSRGLLANQQKYWITNAQVSPEKNLAQQAVSSRTQTVREMRPESFR